MIYDYDISIRISQLQIKNPLRKAGFLLVHTEIIIYIAGDLK
jgi:hypothetical protein